MHDIRLIITLSEEIYNEAIKSGYSYQHDEEVANAVANGIPLPKECGRLIDADAYIEKNEICGWLDDISVDRFNDITPTIIPVSKREE